MEKQPLENTRVRPYVNREPDRALQLKHSMASLQQQLNDMTDKYRMCMKDILALRKEVSKLNGLFKGIAKSTTIGNELPSRECAPPVQQGEPIRQTEPLAQLGDITETEIQAECSHRLRGLKKSRQTAITKMFPNLKTPERRGKKRDAVENERDEEPNKVHVSATPKGTVHVHKTVPSVIIEHESDSDFE